MKVIKKKIKRSCVECGKAFTTQTTIKIVGGLIPVREDDSIICEKCKKKEKTDELEKYKGIFMTN